MPHKPLYSNGLRDYNGGFFRTETEKNTSHNDHQNGLPTLPHCRGVPVMPRHMLAAAQNCTDVAVENCTLDDFVAARLRV